jgi:hypothetical protein
MTRMSVVMDMRTTTMTDQTAQPLDPRVQKAVRALQLTDPLGAKGFRRASERVRSERRARRALFIGVVATFLVILGTIGTSAPPVPQTDPVSDSIIWTIDQNGKVQAAQVVEHVPAAHVRTRSS